MTGVILLAHKAIQEMEADSDSSEDSPHLNTVKRYFIEDSGPTCFNCGVPGHISRDCPESLVVPCFLCGEEGHMRSTCPQECCYNCNEPGHFSRDCPGARRRRPNLNDLCHRCKLPGHIQQDCSLGWRRYKFIVALDKRTFYEKVRNLNRICYSCAGSGHFGDECPYRHSIGYTIFHSPIYEYLQKSNVDHENAHAQPETRKFHGSYRRNVQ